MSYDFGNAICAFPSNKQTPAPLIRFLTEKKALANLFFKANAAVRQASVQAGQLLLLSSLL